MAQKKKWLPRQQSDKLGRKSRQVILSKKDKSKSKRDKGKRRREYMKDHESAGFLFPFVILNIMKDPLLPYRRFFASLYNDKWKRQTRREYFSRRVFISNLTPASPKITFTLPDFTGCPTRGKFNVLSLCLSDIRMPL